MTAPRPGPVWRVTLRGTTRCYLRRLLPDGRAEISGPSRMGWRKTTMTVAASGLFEDREAARVEFRRRGVGR